MSGKVKEEFFNTFVIFFDLVYKSCQVVYCLLSCYISFDHKCQFGGELIGETHDFTHNT